MTEHNKEQNCFWWALFPTIIWQDIILYCPRIFLDTSLLCFESEQKIYSLIDVEINFWYFIYNIKLTIFGTPQRRLLHTGKRKEKGGEIHSISYKITLWKHSERKKTLREREGPFVSLFELLKVGCPLYKFWIYLQKLKTLFFYMS